MRDADFDSEEREFQREIATRLSVLRSNAGACPHPDQIQAASVGVDFEGAERVRQHLEICRAPGLPCLPSRAGCHNRHLYELHPWPTPLILTIRRIFLHSARGRRTTA
jgi:hypothetical protein